METVFALKWIQVLMSARYIEYYEVKKLTGSQYFYMPKNAEAKNKENFDNRSTRIWSFDTKTNRIREVYNRTPNTTLPNAAEFLRIQLSASPVSYSEEYLRLQHAREIINEVNNKKPSKVD
jgi:alpha-galactosidase/6-phospho-beta-glucosidase family protein